MLPAHQDDTAALPHLWPETGLGSSGVSRSFTAILTSFGALRSFVSLVLQDLGTEPVLGGCGGPSAPAQGLAGATGKGRGWQVGVVFPGSRESAPLPLHRLSGFCICYFLWPHTLTDKSQFNTGPRQEVWLWQSRLCRPDFALCTGARPCSPGRQPEPCSQHPVTSFTGTPHAPSLSSLSSHRVVQPVPLSRRRTFHHPKDTLSPSAATPHPLPWRP